MQKCGYAPHANRKGEISYSRIFGRSGYPRFHAYLEPTEKGFRINLHLDQKKPTYGDGNAHSGEYDGEVVEAEGNRIKMVIKGLQR